MLFAAGLVPDTTTRDKLIQSVSYFLSSGPVGGNGWCDLYQVDMGNTTTFGNRVVVGGVYSLLARDLPVKALSVTGGQNTNTGSATPSPVSWDVIIVSAPRFVLGGLLMRIYLGRLGAGFGTFIIIYHLFTVG